MAQVCVCVYVSTEGGGWAQLMIHLSLFPHNSTWWQTVRGVWDRPALCTDLIKTHNLNFFWCKQRQARFQHRTLQITKTHSGQLKTRLLISQLFTQDFLGSVSCSSARPFATGRHLFIERQDWDGWKIRVNEKQVTLIPWESAALSQI